MKLKGHYILDVYSAYKDKLDVPDMLIFESILNELNPRRAQIIYLRYWGNETLREIGSRFCVYAERIRKIEWEILRLLRHPKIARNIRGEIGH